MDYWDCCWCCCSWAKYTGLQHFRYHICSRSIEMTVCVSKIIYAFQLNIIITHHHACITYCIHGSLSKLPECRFQHNLTKSFISEQNACIHQFKRSGVFTYSTHTKSSSVHTHTREEVCVRNKSRCALENKVERKCIMWHHWWRGSFCCTGSMLNLTTQEQQHNESTGSVYKHRSQRTKIQ